MPRPEPEPGPQPEKPSPVAESAAPAAPETASETPAGGWVSHQGGRRRHRPRRPATAKTGSSTVAAAAAERSDARPAGSGSRIQGTPSPTPYSGAAASRWLPILLVLLLAGVIIAVVLL